MQYGQLDLNIKNPQWIKEHIQDPLLLIKADSLNLYSLLDYWSDDRLTALDMEARLYIQVFIFRVKIFALVASDEIEQKALVLMEDTEKNNLQLLWCLVVFDLLVYYATSNKISLFETYLDQVEKKVSLIDNDLLSIQWARVHSIYFFVTQKLDKSYFIAHQAIQSVTQYNESNVYFIMTLSTRISYIFSTLHLYRETALCAIQLFRLLIKYPSVLNNTFHIELYNIIAMSLIRLDKYKFVQMLLEKNLNLVHTSKNVLRKHTYYQYLILAYLKNGYRSKAEQIFEFFIQLDGSQIQEKANRLNFYISRYFLTFQLYKSKQSYLDLKKISKRIDKGFKEDYSITFKTLGEMATEFNYHQSAARYYKIYVEAREELEKIEAKNILLGHKIKLETELIKQKLFETQRWAKEKHRFLSEISHDMRSPLTTIQASAEMLQSEHKGNQYIEGMLESSSHLLSFLDDLIDISAVESNEIKIERTQKKISDWLSKWYKQYERLGAEKGLSTELIIHTSIDLFYTDYKLLRRALDNLMTNAIKYSSKGKIMITLSSASLANELSIVIQDEGKGMTQKIIQSIFNQDKVERKLSNQSHGLGLILAIKLLKMIKGQLKIESEVGVGTRCEVSINNLSGNID